MGAQPHLVLCRMKRFSVEDEHVTKKPTKTQSRSSPFVTHSLTVQHHGGPSALLRRITIFSYQTRIHYHVWMQLKLAASSDWPPLRINATNHRPTFPLHLSAVRFSGVAPFLRLCARRAPVVMPQTLWYFPTLLLMTNCRDCAAPPT